MFFVLCLLVSGLGLAGMQVCRQKLTKAGLAALRIFFCHDLLPAKIFVQDM
ncbi:MAG: hypothetical protein IAB19_02170 [Proteobacteria bacterium]|uniref:Uncharacterized protein n=1 Tax=Candidatus Avisuccinivibrio stercorigallinarum TaxID=2840704 RepID=A0A9D9DA08_9GAMM|nr:hypothetical protein [Candidatus Avisuccinivibrio stercorigallinarum]